MKWSREAARWTLSRIHRWFFEWVNIWYRDFFFKKALFIIYSSWILLFFAASIYRASIDGKQKLKREFLCASILQQSRWFACVFIYMKISTLSLRQESALFFLHLWAHTAFIFGCTVSAVAKRDNNIYINWHARKLSLTFLSPRLIASRAIVVETRRTCMKKPDFFLFWKFSGCT